METIYVPFKIPELPVRLWAESKGIEFNTREKVQIAYALYYEDVKNKN